MTTRKPAKVLLEQSVLQFSCCHCASAVVDSNTARLCSRAEAEGAVLVCQEVESLHFYKLLLQQSTTRVYQ